MDDFGIVQQSPNGQSEGDCHRGEHRQHSRLREVSPR